MTAQKAIELLQKLNVKLAGMSGHETNGIEKIFGWNEITAICEAIKALEEIQQYRAIGTPDECRAAVEKQKAMKVTDIHVDEYYCPACGSENTTSNALTGGDHYCPNCGQRLER